MGESYDPAGLCPGKRLTRSKPAHCPLVGKPHGESDHGRSFGLLALNGPEACAHGCYEVSFPAPPSRLAQLSAAISASSPLRASGITLASKLGLGRLHQPLTARGLELIRCNFGVAVDVNHLEVDDVGYCLVLRYGRSVRRRHLPYGLALSVIKYRARAT
jgi:hypothetical protein